MIMEIGETYTIKCGWGDTKAKLEYIVGDVHHFKAVDNGFKFLSNGAPELACTFSFCGGEAVSKIKIEKLIYQACSAHAVINNKEDFALYGAVKELVQ